MGHNVMKLGELLAAHDTEAVRAAVIEAIEKETPRASSVASILDRRARARSAPTVLPAHLPNDPRVRDLDVVSHDPATYDVLTKRFSDAE